ncbi:hypothetical protein [Spirosoma agri]|uniref:Uncharacterized protein n=1 Tax=Spirosoma agri TaxID=1987381 RepID=A0A6M0IDC2_9BACT|nr:hypothetical protein [Spirosoma agri]NEU66168.1 hypothetical protein [Spirosoma agri]
MNCPFSFSVPDEYPDKTNVFRRIYAVVTARLLCTTSAENALYLKPGADSVAGLPMSGLAGSVDVRL